MATLNFDYGLTCNFANAGVVAGATSTITTTFVSNACINGIFIAPYAAQNAASPTVDIADGLAFDTLPPNSTCTLLVGLTAAGALAMTQGQTIPTNVGVTTTVGSFLREPQFPGIPDGFVPLAYTIVRTAPSAAPWIPGTGAWTASGVTATAFRNVAQLPARPQIS